jgi:hypothetical protein
MKFIQIDCALCAFLWLDQGAALLLLKATIVPRQQKRKPLESSGFNGPSDLEIFASRREVWRHAGSSRCARAAVSTDKEILPI